MTHPIYETMQREYLRAVQANPSIEEPVSAFVERLTAERDAAVARADKAEHRISQFEHWARKALKGDADPVRVLEDVIVGCADLCNESTCRACRDTARAKKAEADVKELTQARDHAATERDLARIFARRSGEEAAAHKRRADAAEKRVADLSRELVLIANALGCPLDQCESAAKHWLATVAEATAELAASRRKADAWSPVLGIVLRFFRCKYTSEHDFIADLLNAVKAVPEEAR